MSLPTALVSVKMTTRIHCHCQQLLGYIVIVISSWINGKGNKNKDTLSLRTALRSMALRGCIVIANSSWVSAIDNNTLSLPTAHESFELMRIHCHLPTALGSVELTMRIHGHCQQLLGLWN
ncbi:hypothetical protein CHS0354_032645 [Potamilus streckersoni]|uniref:Uncharacterized protein n=1 Tax=Potamilus streckersoni TaxID=2493646 RepID=A0AAE0VUV1_9BIVA|nr:hypothetical protein CHS0354_032645 [Potamilus streckersoni]